MTPQPHVFAAHLLNFVEALTLPSAQAMVMWPRHCLVPTPLAHCS